jgi:UDP-GlcNAc3NAcA epimerase
VTDRVSRWLFTPTEAAQAHLIREGTHPANVFPVGDVMLDAFRRCAPLAPPVEQVIGLSAGEYVLATVHRPHHVDDPQVLHSLLDALTQLSQHIPVIFPVHPRTRQAMDGWSCPPGIRLLEPQGYLQILSLLRSCRVLVSDSGGLQKEAYFAGRRCVILNPGTEWVELVQLGWNLLLPEHSGLVQTVLNMSPQPPAVDGALYGGGQASRRIAHILSGQPDWSQLDAPALQRA